MKWTSIPQMYLQETETPQIIIKIDLSKIGKTSTNENYECSTANMLKSINLSDLIKDDTQPNEDNNADYDTNVRLPTC
ncbi:hypothetical protein PR048_017116 [Dryococelus australis]|uniref:Uncharacterized protein n=1 Tax=Dryococelus australis TaxID=614101 RepID=A0ABQ9H8Q5_9NEOP|nr:hypothetical protein PR048_017116 [Dryococelus australis]